MVKIDAFPHFSNKIQTSPPRSTQKAENSAGMWMSKKRWDPTNQFYVELFHPYINGRKYTG